MIDPRNIADLVKVNSREQTDGDKWGCAMTESMVDNVARAILKSLIAEGEYIKDLGDGLIKIDGCVDLPEIARAAIEAMREPTEAMIRAEYEYDYYDGNRGRLTHEAEEVWGLMIDAALKEQEKVG